MFPSLFKGSFEFKVMEGAESEQSMSAPGGECASFDWKSHVKNLVKQGFNWSFQCAYCPKKMIGGKTRLVEHFCPSTAKSKHLAPCLRVPPEVIEAAHANQGGDVLG